MRKDWKKKEKIGKERKHGEKKEKIGKRLGKDWWKRKKRWGKERKDWERAMSHTDMDDTGWRLTFTSRQAHTTDTAHRPTTVEKAKAV